MNAPGFHVAPAVPAATRANEAAGPALVGQMLPALLLISKLLAKLFHRQNIFGFGFSHARQNIAFSSPEQA